MDIFSLLLRLLILLLLLLLFPQPGGHPQPQSLCDGQGGRLGAEHRHHDGLAGEVFTSRVRLHWITSPGGPGPAHNLTLSVCVCVFPALRVLGFQKRWVRLEVDYLRYFEKDKVSRMEETSEEPRIVNMYNVCVFVCVAGGGFQGLHLHGLHHTCELCR